MDFFHKLVNHLTTLDENENNQLYYPYIWYEEDSNFPFCVSNDSGSGMYAMTYEEFLALLEKPTKRKWKNSYGDWERAGGELGWNLVLVKQRVGDGRDGESRFYY